MYIGLDIGTSGTKAALVDETGRVRKSAQVSYGFCNTKGGCRELDAREVWEAALSCLRQTGGGGAAETITVSALGEAVVLVDRDGNPLAPGITGTDIRGGEQPGALIARYGARTLTEITGQNLSSIYSANKILWLKENQAGLYEKAWKILTFQDYIIYRLCREAKIDRSMASRTLLFDIDRGDWSDRLLSDLQIGREKLSRVVPAGSTAGELTREAAEAAGLSPGTKVIVGTHDHICNAIGSGVCEAGSCADTVGTTEGLTAVLEPGQLMAEEIEKYQISREPFAVDGLYNTVAWNNTSGVLLKWFVNEMVREEKPDEILKTFDKMNGAIKEEPTGLFVLPHFSGAATPYMDSASRGAVLGLTLDTKREDIYKALMEGANYELALILDGLVSAGLVPRKIVATGGALSPQLLQIKADVLGHEITTVKNRQTGTLGGAILGAAAQGAYRDIRSAVRAMVQEDRVYRPDPERSQIYREKLEIYKKIYPAIAEISHSIVQ